MSGNTMRAGTEEEFRAWRQERWNEITGPGGKASVAAKTVISGTEEQSVEGIPGTWRINEEGDLTVTATAADGIRVNNSLVEGAAVVPPRAIAHLHQGTSRDGRWGGWLLRSGRPR